MFPVQLSFSYLDMNYSIHLVNLHKKSHKITSKPKYGTLWVRLLAGNLIGGQIIYSQNLEL
jgi:hypothetical protein